MANIEQHTEPNDELSSKKEGGENRPKTIFENKETVKRRIEWEDAPSAKLRDALDILFPGIEQSMRTELSEIILQNEKLSLDLLGDVVKNRGLARKIAKEAHIAIGKPYEKRSLLDRVLMFVSPAKSTTHGMVVARALRWHGANTGRNDLSVLYPASGSDQTGFLNHIGQTPVKRVDCVTVSGPRGADEKIRTSGKNARLINKEFMKAIADGDVPDGSVDALLLDGTGFSTFSSNDNMPETIKRILAPNGIIVTAGGYMSTGSIVQHMLEKLPSDKFRLVAAPGDDYIVERKS